MNNKRYYVIFETAAGWIGLSGSDVGLSKATLPLLSGEQARIALGMNVVNALCSESYFENVIQEYLNYFEGQQVEFVDSLDLENHTSFECAVWKATHSIPYGKTKSYAEIARQIGKPSAPRAVGQALGKNPLPIIVPCHRVVASDGKLGGFGGGLPMKRYLLKLEAASKI
jgi:methylated-DNA-[protein]-cysteine S-methyltransferase